MPGTDCPAKLSRDQIRGEIATILAKGLLRQRQLRQFGGAHTTENAAQSSEPSNSPNTLANSLHRRLNSRQHHGSL